MFRLKKKNFPLNHRFSAIPDDIRSRMALVDGILHISDELKNNLYMIDFVSKQKRYGLIKISFHSPKEFNNEFSRQTILHNIDTNHNELQSLVKSILEKAYQEKASDIHIKDLGTHCLIRFRIIGRLSDHATYTAEQGRAIIAGIYNTMCQSCSHPLYSSRERLEGRIVDTNLLPDGVYSIRVHTEPTERTNAPESIGSCMYLRLLYDATSAEGNLDNRLKILGFLPSQREVFNFLTTRTGLVIIAGPTGHGKSTVLKHCQEAMVIERPQKAFMSVEDPPEYIIHGIDQIAVSTKEENRGKAYIDAIAGAMRSDVDSLLIGEMRYAESVIAAINAAMTGHAVWATMHANDAIGIILRASTILTEKGYGNALEHICEPSVLAGLIYQRLIPILCPYCSLLLTEVKEYDESMSNKLLEACTSIENIRILGNGCEHCNQQGLIGQKVAAEVIATDATLLKHIRQGEFAKAKQYFIEECQGITHVQHALKLIETGQADPMLTEDRLGLPLNIERLCL